MRISSDINDKAMAQFKAIVHEGVTEKELADQMLKIYTDLGADGYSLNRWLLLVPMQQTRIMNRTIRY